MRMRTQAVTGILASAALSVGVLASPASAAEQTAPAGSAGPAKVAGSAGPAKVAGSAATAAANSTTSAENRTMSYRGVFTADGVRIHANSPSGPVVGLGYNGQPVTVHCHIPGPVAYEWVYGTNNATGVTGYIHWSLVSYGASLPCS